MASQPGASRRITLFLLVIILPLAFASIGGWQFTRATREDGSLARLEAAIADIKSIQEKAGGKHVLLRTPGGKTIPAGAALARFEQLRKDRLARAYYTRLFRLPLAGCAAFFGLGAAAIGAWGLFAIRRAGARALLSRDELLSGFRSGLRHIPWIIAGVGFFMATALACVLAYEIIAFASGGIKGKGSARLVIIGVVAVATLFFFAGKLVWNMYTTSRAAFACEPLRLMGRSVTESEAPSLWAFVRSIAQRTATATPDAIVLGLDEGFFVTEHPIQFTSGSPAPAGRILYLPLPYMAFMEKNEAEAVIAHELGHFSGEDTAYSLHFAPMYASAVNNIHAVYAASDSFIAKPVLALGEYYLESFDLAVQHWSRERELAADRVGADVAGGEAVALSLLRASLLAQHVHEALAECWENGGIPGGIVARVREIVAEKGLGDPAEHLEEAQSHPLDSHPSTRERLEAIGMAPSPEFFDKVRAVRETTLLRDLGILPGETHDEKGAACPVQSISLLLEEEYFSAAKSHAAETTEALRAIAEGGKEDLPLHEGMRTTVCFVILTLLGAGTCVLGVARGSTPLIAGGLASAALLLWATMYFAKRRDRPFATLTAKGLLVGNLTEPIPWTAIEDYSVTIYSQTMILALSLADGYEPPAFSGDMRARYRPKQHDLYITAASVGKPHTLESACEAFFAYWQAGLARHELARRGKAEKTDP